ncbi:hypothetical protein [Actinomadura sp. 9N215]|uniref:hypothetical protein n=1 Tax=Actinomadura sp. 9N215 TaxID=3375150 RepID=UPI0037A00910
MTAPVTVFSAHLDDAVLSASARLMRPGTRSVTVFAGPPPADLPLSGWGRITRAASLGERHAERLAEDSRAMEGLDCPTIRLDLHEFEFRPNAMETVSFGPGGGKQEQTVSRVAEAVASLVEESSEIWIPAAVGRHLDHLATRQGLLAAWRALDARIPVRYYADQPYSTVYGWPGWMTGETEPRYFHTGTWLEHELTSCGLDPDGLVPVPEELDPQSRRRKRRAVMTYQTQLRGLCLGPDDDQRRRHVLSHELSWRMAEHAQAECA